MYSTFEQILAQVRTDNPITIAVAAAEDAPTLKAVHMAVEKRFVKPILFGHASKIIDILNELQIDPGSYDIVQAIDEEDACGLAARAVADGKADLPMKGLARTRTFLKAILDKDLNLRTENRMSIISILDLKKLDRIIILTDTGMNINLDVFIKKQIIENAVAFMHLIKVDNPRVAILAALEKINEEMPATFDAALLTKMWTRDQIKGCIVDGPFGLDNALDEKAARIKGIKSPVAGKADILIMPNIEAGNMLYKAFAYFSDLQAAHLCWGAKVPIIVPSRIDSYLTKFYSIALGKFILDS